MLYEIREELKTIQGTSVVLAFFVETVYFHKKIISFSPFLVANFISISFKLPSIDYKISSKILYFVD